MSSDLEAELSHVLLSIDTGSHRDRNHKILQRHLGFGGKPGVSMQAAGAPFNLTRESVRQIRNRFAEEAVERSGPSEIPILYAVLEAMRELAPASGDSVQGELAKRGLIQSHTSLDFVLRAATLFGLEDQLPLRIRVEASYFILRAEQARLIKDVQKRATKAASKRGAVEVRALTPLVPVEDPVKARAFVVDLMDAQKKTCWINDDWLFFGGSSRNCVVTRLKKIFSVVEETAFDQVVSALRRSMRKAKPLPDDILWGLLRADERFQIDDGGVVRAAEGQHFDPDESLRDFEKMICRRLIDSGQPFVREKQLEEALVRDRTAMYSFSMVLSYSPLFCKYKGKRGCYALVGKPMDQARQDLAS